MLTSSPIFKELENSWRLGLKETEFNYIKSIISTQNYKKYLATPPRKNWIEETIKKYKIRYKLKDCKTLVFVGSGINPYSLIDLQKTYNTIKMIGIDYDEKCVKISRFLIEKCNVSNIDIVCINGLEFNYSALVDEDLVFLSVDIEFIDEIYSTVIKTSRAQPYVCAPGKHAWFINTYKPK